jgi:hypothetical protein
MASDSEARYKQRAVIEFLTTETETVGNIHTRVQNVYADCSADRSTVERWAKLVRSSERGNANLDDESRSGQQGIQDLVYRWQKAVEKDGDYVEEIVLVNKVCDCFYPRFQLFAIIFGQENNIKYGAKLTE